MYIPYGRQCIDEDDIRAVTDVLKSDFLTTGPKSSEFEEAVCNCTGAKYAVAVSNGTAALHAACYAAGIGAGDEVITTPLTFAASANCVLYFGGTPVFADVDPKTYNIDPADIEKKITSRTKAIIPVHLAGQPCDLDAIYKIAEKHHFIVIEDAAHALGAKYHGKMIGTSSGMTTLSFHPVKPVTTGEGGMILTDQKELYQKLLLFRSHCITRDASAMKKTEGAWYYEQSGLGFNYRLTDLQCALGISQLKKLEHFLERRKKLALQYQEAFAHCPYIITPYQLPGTESGWHLYLIQIPYHNRKQVFERLREAGIGVNVHYIPVYHHPYYQEHGYADTFCRNAEQIYKNIITLPLYPSLTDHEQQYVIQKVLEVLQMEDQSLGLEYNTNKKHDK
ncbi:MAG: UDP-4-amino-4,6-dideoxy-N-acetyl-beta-L-altrosamine transaminase [Eubacterium sp.]|nr:UDP-4-amino-4,6-dideoxy-N-acetyl-beta-L-altrosamine transaminase [Eubacterium sp.]